VGADIGLHVGKNFMNEWPERNYKAFIFPLLNEAGMLGEKSGKGFYAFDKKCVLMESPWRRVQQPKLCLCEVVHRDRLCTCCATISV
jgi:3-hydroxyacyl-CoA dehydrogenase